MLKRKMDACLNAPEGRGGSGKLVRILMSFASHFAPAFSHRFVQGVTSCVVCVRMNTSSSSTSSALRACNSSNHCVHIVSICMCSYTPIVLYDLDRKTVFT